MHFLHEIISVGLSQNLYAFSVRFFGIALECFSVNDFWVMRIIWDEVRNVYCWIRVEFNDFVFNHYCSRAYLICFEIKFCGN